MLRGIKLPDAYQSIDKRNNWDGVSIVAAGDIPSDVYTIHQIGPFLAFTFVPLRQTRFIIFMPHYTPLSDGSLKKEVSLVFNDDPVIHHKLTFKSPEDSAQFLVTYFEMLSLTEKLISRLNPKTCFKTAEIVIALPNSKVPQRAVGEIKAIDSGYEFEIRAFSGKTQSVALSIKLTRTVSCFPSIRNSIFGKLDNIINTITIAQTYKDPFTVIMCGGPADVMSWILALYSFSSNIGRFPNRKMGFRKDDDIQRDVERVAKDFRDEEEARLKAEEEARIKAEEEARLKAEEEARLKAEEEARLKAEEEARLKAEEEARLKAEEEARLKAEEEARLKAEEEARLKAEEEARLKAEEEARLKAEEEARLKAEEEARLKAEEETRLKAEEEARLKAEEEARLKAEEEARIKAEEEARLKAEEEARLKAEEEARLKAEEEARLKAEEEARLKAEEEARLKAEEEARIKAEEEARLKAEEEARLKAEEEARLMTQNTNNDEISLNQTMQSELQAILDSMNPKETPILDLQFSLPSPELNFDEAVSLLDDIYQSFPEPQQRELSPISIQDSLQPTFDSPTTSFTQFASYIKSLNNCIQELIKNPNDQEQVSALVSLISALIDNGMKETSSPSSFFPQHFGKTSSEIARNALQKQSVLGVIYCLESAQKHYEEWAICRDLQTMNTINEILSQLGPIFITNELPIEESIFAKSNLFPLYNLHKIVRHDISSDEKLLETSNEFANAIIPVVKKRSVLGFGSGDSSDFIMEACGQSHQWISPLKSQKIQGIFAEAVRRSKLGEIINDSIQNKAAVEKWLHEDSPLTDKASAEYIIRAAMFLCQRYMQSSGY